MGRAGLNCTLSYRRSGVRRAYQVRANLLTHGMQVIYEESQSRTRRAFYPHRLSSAQFTLGIQVVGEAEYTSLSGWLASYAEYVLSPNLRFGEFPAMAVSLPSRNFIKKGVPLSGYEWGDEVGKMMWTLGVTFETSEEPADAGRLIQPSYATGAALYARDTRFFYPTGTQLSGQAAPADGTYTKPVDSESLADLINSAAASFGAGSSAAADRAAGY